MSVIYAYNDVAVNAYILAGGKVTFMLPCGDFFSISGENIIFGVPEVLLGWEKNTLTNRLYNADAGEGTAYKKIPKANLKKFIEHYNVGFNITREIARSLKEVNQLVQVRLDSMSEKERRSQEYAKGFAQVVQRIGEEYELKRFPILKSLNDEYANSLTFTYGIGFQRMAHKTQLDIERKLVEGLLRTYRKEEVLCRQGDPGSELFILMEGRLAVFMGENEEPIAHVETPGEVIGEMSLLLNAPRTATLVADETTVISVVRKEDLQQVAESRPDFFYQLGVTLSHRLENQVGMLEDIVARDQGPRTPESLIEDPHRDAFMSLERKLLSASLEHDIPVLRELHQLLRSIKARIK